MSDTHTISSLSQAMEILYDPFCSQDLHRWQIFQQIFGTAPKTSTITGDASSASFLLSHGCDVHSSRPDTLETGLHLVGKAEATLGKEDTESLVGKLIDRGANINAQDAKSLWVDINRHFNSFYLVNQYMD